jgi:hypothetical protein
MNLSELALKINAHLYSPVGECCTEVTGINAAGLA